MESDTFIEVLNSFFESVGAPLILALFYWFRFHTQQGTRSYTTGALFYAGVALFVAPFLLIYSLLPDELGVFTALWIVMLLWLVPGLPGWWRDACHAIARIPSFAYNLRDALLAAPFELTSEDEAAVRRKLARIGYRVDDIQAVQSTAIQSRFLKITTVMHHLEQWSTNGEAFLKRNSEQYFELLRVYDLLSFKAIRALKNTASIYGAILEESKVQPDDWHALALLAARDTSSTRLQTAAQNAAGTMLEDLRKDMDFMLDSLLLFLARMVLSGSWSFRRRKAKLESMGFMLSLPPPDVMRSVIGAIAITFGWSLIWLFMLGDREVIAGNVRYGVLRVYLLSPIMLIAAFWLVHYLKRNYAFANEGMSGRRPIGFIFLVGVLSALLSFPLQALFDYLQLVYRFDEQRDALAILQAYLPVLARDLPVLIYPAAIGATTALLAQESMWDHIISGRKKRVMDGLVFGLGLSIAVVLVVAIDRVSPIPVMAKMHSWPIGKVIFAMLIPSAAFGFVIGFLVISPIRRGSTLYVTYNDLISRTVPLRETFRLCTTMISNLSKGHITSPDKQRTS
jgi:hypothetical protein